MFIGESGKTVAAWPIMRWLMAQAQSLVYHEGIIWSAAM